MLLQKGKLIPQEILEVIHKQEIYRVIYDWAKNRPRMCRPRDYHKSLNLIKLLYYEINLVHAVSLSKAKVVLNQVLIEIIS